MVLVKNVVGIWMGKTFFPIHTCVHRYGGFPTTTGRFIIGYKVV